MLRTPAESRQAIPNGVSSNLISLLLLMLKISFHCIRDSFRQNLTNFLKLFSIIFDANKRHTSLHQDIHRLSCLYCYNLCQYAPTFPLLFNYYVRYLFFFRTTLFSYIEYGSKNNQYNTDTYNNDYRIIPCIF